MQPRLIKFFSWASSSNKLCEVVLFQFYKLTQVKSLSYNTSSKADSFILSCSQRMFCVSQWSKHPQSILLWNPINVKSKLHTQHHQKVLSNCWARDPPGWSLSCFLHFDCDRRSWIHLPSVLTQTASALHNKWAGWGLDGCSFLTHSIPVSAAGQMSNLKDCEEFLNDLKKSHHNTSDCSLQFEMRLSATKWVVLEMPILSFLPRV